MTSPLAAIDWSVLQPLWQWMHDHPGLVTAMLGVSLLTIIGSAIAAPIILARLPADYFAHDRRPAPSIARHHPVLRLAVRAMKNLLGAALLVAGITMLVLPGPGLVTMVVGLILLDLPRKYALQRWLATRPGVPRAINWIRRRAGKPPMVLTRANVRAARVGQPQDEP